MTEDAQQKQKAYEAFNKLKKDKEQDNEFNKNMSIVKHKEAQLQQLLEVEAQLADRLSKTKDINHGLQKH